MLHFKNEPVFCNVFSLGKIIQTFLKGNGNKNKLTFMICKKCSPEQIYVFLKLFNNKNGASI